MIKPRIMRCRPDKDIYFELLKQCMQHTIDSLIHFTKGALYIFPKPNEAMMKAKLGRYKAHKNVDVQKTVVGDAEMLSFNQKSSSPRMLIRNSETEALFEHVNFVVDYCDHGGYIKEIPSDLFLRVSKTKSWCPDTLLGLNTSINILRPLETANSDRNEIRVVSLKRILRWKYKTGVSLPLSECASEPKPQSVAAGGWSSWTPCQSARYPKYLDQNERLYSFATWRWISLDRIHLANIGFFYTGNGDLIRCCVCGIGLKGLQPGDDVMKEHIRYSGDCGFLVQLFGPDLLKQKQKELAVEDLFYTGYHQNVPTSPNTGSSQPLQDTVIPIERSPRLRTLEARLRTFVGWPRTRTHTPFQVAEAGFYYTGERDIVQCWSCHGGLKDWDPNDDPWIEHCHWFPFCPFARETKGDAYIAQVKSWYESRSNQQKVSAPSQEQATNAQPVDQLVKPMTVLAVSEMSTAVNNANGTRIPNVETVKDRQTWRSDVAESVLDMGFEEDDVRRAVTELKTERIEETVERTIDKIDSMTKKKEELEDLIAENICLKRIVVCNGCDKQRNALFLPCQHHNYCGKCAGHMAHCPACGQKIMQVIKTSFS